MQRTSMREQTKRIASVSSSSFAQRGADTSIGRANVVPITSTQKFFHARTTQCVAPRLPSAEALSKPSSMRWSYLTTAAGKERLPGVDGGLCSDSQAELWQKGMPDWTPYGPVCDRRTQSVTGSKVGSPSGDHVSPRNDTAGAVYISYLGSIVGGLWSTCGHVSCVLFLSFKVHHTIPYKLGACVLRAIMAQSPAHMLAVAQVLMTSCNQRSPLCSRHRHW